MKNTLNKLIKVTYSLKCDLTDNLTSVISWSDVLCSIRSITMSLRNCFCPSFCLPALFREFGGARCVHNIVKYRQCREHALLIIQQLVLSPSGDDDMGTLLGLMHSAPSSELQLKTDILRVTTHTHKLSLS